MIIERDKIKIGDYRLKIDSIFAYYPTTVEENDRWFIVIERDVPDGITELEVEFDTEEERDKVLLELDKLCTIDPMNLRKEKLEEINKNGKI